MKGKIGQRAYTDRIPAVMAEAMAEWSTLTGRHVAPIDTYRIDRAELVSIEGWRYDAGVKYGLLVAQWALALNGSEEGNFLETGLVPGAAVHVGRLGQNVGHVILDCLFAEREPVRDFFIAHSIGDELQNLHLARRQR